MKGLEEHVLNESSVCAPLLQKYSSVSDSTNSTTTHINTNVLFLILQQHQQQQLHLNKSGGEDIDSDNLSAQITEEWATNKIEESLEALKVFNQYEAALDNLFERMSLLCVKAINNTISVMELQMRDGISDVSHLAQLTQVVSCFGGFAFE